MTTDRPQLPPAYWANQIRADLRRRRGIETETEMDEGNDDE
jgi:hypothetical protein